MARNQSKGKKGKKNAKQKIQIRKFNLDLFGLLTFTRIYGGPFTDFMIEPKKKGKQAKKPQIKGKKGKKKKEKKIDVPNLPKFDKLSDLPINKLSKKELANLNVGNERSLLPFAKSRLPNVGYDSLDKRKPPTEPPKREGSISDVLCGPSFPLPPRPQPHGGIMGDIVCPACKMVDNLMRVPYHQIHKKMRKLIYRQFDKAEYAIRYLSDQAHKAVETYREHIQNIIEVLGPILDAFEKSEWDDHFEVKALMDKWKGLRREILKVKAEYRHLRDHQQEEIDKLLAEKKAEVDAAEKRMHELEMQLKNAIETLEDWRANSERKLREPKEEIERLLQLLQDVKNSVYNERDFLRELLAWETQKATEETIAAMERIIADDIAYMLNWMHPSWFRLVLENQKLKSEEELLTSENHLLELEVCTLQRQINKLVALKNYKYASRTLQFRPPSLSATIARFFRLQGEKFQLHGCSSTNDNQ